MIWNIYLFIISESD